MNAASTDDTDQTSTADDLLQAADICRLSDGRFTPSAVRAAAARGELPTAVVSIRGVKMFWRRDALAFLAKRGLAQESSR